MNEIALRPATPGDSEFCYQLHKAAERGVRVRRGSYDDPAALLDSFEGAEQVLLVSSNAPAADHGPQHPPVAAIVHCQ